MKLKITITQLNAIGNAASMLSAMVGTGSSFDAEAKKTVAAIDRFLKSNGFKRKYN